MRPLPVRTEQNHVAAPLQLSNRLSAFAKLAQGDDGLPVRRSAEFQSLRATKARRLERPQASFGLRAALPIDSDLPTAGVAAVHPLLRLENAAARVFIARPARLLGFL